MKAENIIEYYSPAIEHQGRYECDDVDDEQVACYRRYTAHGRYRDFIVMWRQN